MSTPQRGEGGGGGNFWTKKYGPLPAWGWAAILLVLIIAYEYYKSKKTGTTTSNAGTSTAANSTTSSLVPQWINQTYINETPPSAPSPSQPTTQVPQGAPIAFLVPNGTGGWMTAVFPSQQAQQNYFTSLGIGAGQPNGGYYPNGLTYTQIVAAINQAGGQVAQNPIPNYGETSTSTYPLPVSTAGSATSGSNSSAMGTQGILNTPSVSGTVIRGGLPNRTING